MADTDGEGVDPPCMADADIGEERVRGVWADEEAQIRAARVFMLWKRL